MSAVSASPLRAPWVEVKYSSTVSPSRKFEVMGVSMTSPDGLAMSPRIPASCRICCFDPRAPESAIMKIGLKSPPSARTSISLNSSSAICSVTCAHTSTTLLYRSPLVMTPSWYCCSTSVTRRRAFSMRPPLEDGMCMSTIPMLSPDRVA